MKQYPLRFLAAWAVVGVIGAVAIALFIAIMFTPVTPVAHKTDVTNALGATTVKALTPQAEEYIAAGAKSSGTTVTEQKYIKYTVPAKNVIDIWIKVTYVDGSTGQLLTTKLAVEFRRDIYTIVSVANKGS